MVDEVYSVVDRDGNKIGKATWTEVHSQGLLHQTVHGILFKDNTRSKILLKKRTKNADQEPNVLEIAAAGHVLLEETSNQAMKRELAEEILGNKLNEKEISIKKIGKYFNTNVPLNNEISYLYEIFYNGPFFRDKSISGKPFWVDFKFLIEDMRLNPGKYAQYSINAIREYIRLMKYSKKRL
jgi:isopentenyldiphosphate isomerase